MRKIILCFAALATMMLLVSCESCSSNKVGGVDLIYNVEATATGNVEFKWFNGGANVNGDAKIYQCNDTTKSLATNEIIPFRNALESDDYELSSAAQKINDMIEVNGVEGKYHLTIKGYVKYGPLVFEIDEEYPISEPADSIK